MKKINFLPWFMLLLATLAACAEDKDVPQKQGTPLQLSVTTTKLQSKALIEASTLPDESTLGLSLVDAGGRTYDKAVYDNVKANAVGTGISQTWSFETDLMLSGAEGTLYAYHPFDPEVNDVRHIAVSAGETDYMWASPVSGLLFSNAKAQVTMNHALSAIRLKVVRGSYKGDGHVTSLTVKADNIASSATLDATTGSLSEMAGAGTPLERSVDFTLSESSEKVDFVVVPVLKKGAAATFTLVVDGKAYTVGASQLTYEQGSLYTYTLTVNSADLSLSDVTVGDWGYNTDGEPVIRVNGKTVTLTGNTEGIAFNNAVNPDGTVTIQAYTIVPQKHVEEVFVSGSSTLQQTLDEETGIRTITLSGITADEEVNFQGVWYPVYIEGDMDGMTFARRRAADGSLTVTATPDDAEDIVKEASGSGEATFTQTVDATTNVRTLTVSAQNSPYTINMNGISSTWLVATYDITATGSTQILYEYSRYFDISTISAMKVDGVSVTIDDAYNFTSTGVHVVKYKFKDNTQIPQYMFTEINTLKTISIPVSVKKIGYRAFSNCSGLTAINLGIGVQTIGNYAFHGCSGLTEIIIPNSVITIGEQAFMNCSGLTAIKLGIGVKTIGKEAFYRCSALSSITSKAITAPSISEQTFSTVKSKGTLFVPTDATGYDTWMQTSSYYLGYYKWTLQEQLFFLPTECTSLTITADNVNGYNNTANIKYYAVCNGIDESIDEKVFDIIITGSVVSDDFGQNPSTTDSREVTISFTYLGKTATTTITQSPYVPAYYTVNLNNQWQNSSKLNPNSSLYDGVYESFSNYNVSNSGATMTITVFGYKSFTVYIRSYAESSYDYVMASALNQNITYSTSYSNTTLVKAHTSGSQSSGTAISNYKEVIYDIPDDGKEHTITIVYRKDGSANSGDDKGYLLIAKP